MFSRYEIRVDGQLGETMLCAFAGFAAEVHPHDTLLVGDLADQSALYGVLDTIDSLGLQLLEVRKLHGWPE